MLFLVNIVDDDVMASWIKDFMVIDEMDMVSPIIGYTKNMPRKPVIRRDFRGGKVLGRDD